jgi:hypothetical protein
MNALVFTHYDQAVMFKILNNLPKNIEAKYIDNRRSALYEGSKIHRMKLTKEMIGKEWLTSF